MRKWAIKTAILFVTALIVVPIFAQDPNPVDPTTVLGSTHFRHSDQATCVAFSPDGALLASGGWDRMVRIWNVKDGSLKQTLDEPEGYVNALTWSTDGSLLGCASSDSSRKFGNGKTISSRRWHTLHVWNLDTGDVAFRHEGHQFGATDIALSPDNKTVYSAGTDGTFRAYDLNSRELQFEVKRHDQPIESLALSPDGTEAITTSLQRPTIHWTLGGEEPEGVACPLTAAGAYRNPTVYHSSGESLYFIDERGAVVHRRFDTGETLRSFGPLERSTVTFAFSPDEAWLATVDRKNTFTLWSMETGKPVASDTGNYADTPELSFSPDGKRLAAACRDGNIYVWNIEENDDGVSLTRHLPPVGHTYRVTHLTWAGDSKHLFSASWDRSLIRWDTETEEITATITDIPSSAEYITPGPNNQLAVVDGAHGLQVYDANDLSEQAIPDWLDLIRIGPFEWTTDGTRFLIGDASEHVFSLRNAESGREELRISHFEEIYAVPKSGRLLAVGGTDLALFDLSVGTLIDREVVKGAYITNLVFSADGRWIGITTSHGQALLYEVASRSVVASYPLTKLTVYGIDVSPDGRWLAAGTSEGSVHLIPLIDNQEGETWNPGAGLITELRFSPDGSRLAAACGNGTVCLKSTPELNPIPDQPRPESEALREHWTSLASEDATAAWISTAALIRARDIDAWLDAQIRSTLAGRDQIRAWIQELGHPDFETRENAQLKLEEAGREALGFIAEALEKKASPEMTTRLKGCLETIQQELPSRPSTSLLRSRAFYVLETRGAFDTLEKLYADFPAPFSELKAIFQRHGIALKPR